MPRLTRTSAVALRYHPQAPYLDLAPRLVAKGEGLLADRILLLAKQNGIPIEHDPNLLAALAPLQVDRVLPPELFKAVAILLAALYRANGTAGSFGT